MLLHFFPLLLPSISRSHTHPHTHTHIFILSLCYYSESASVVCCLLCRRLYGLVSWTSVETDLLSMACHPSSSGSYTVVIIPLRNSLYSLDALRFYLWIKRLKDLEREKDALWSGLEILERARFWYLQRLHENRTRQDNIETKTRLGSYKEDPAETRSCLLRSRILRVNGSLGSVMTEPNVMSSSNPSLPETVADSDLRWHNSVLTQGVSDRNRQISVLELEKDALLEQLDELQVY
ncbi:suppressor APC domain-containing protein 1 isoform X1 [Platichthys flesus]|uniref:suppressor APC domain-containing protein 1 isoform X1 n=1 Tax=Platichthys flesus TaxID=8260 RepID=UPI002DBDB7D8|nr:suppressor APC domain-containing protein 1 isoform X1 [Platichthys flesus]